MWPVTSLSLIGVILNIYKRKECFYIWTVTNAAWAIYDYYIGAHEQAALFVIYFFLAIWGIIQWKKNDQ